jgi:hypothetical protein
VPIPESGNGYAPLLMLRQVHAMNEFDLSETSTKNLEAGLAKLKRWLPIWSALADGPTPIQLGRSRALDRNAKFWIMH